MTSFRSASFRPGARTAFALVCVSLCGMLAFTLSLRAQTPASRPSPRDRAAADGAAAEAADRRRAARGREGLRRILRELSWADARWRAGADAAGRRVDVRRRRRQPRADHPRRAAADADAVVQGGVERTGDPGAGDLHPRGARQGARHARHREAARADRRHGGSEPARNIQAGSSRRRARHAVGHRLAARRQHAGDRAHRPRPPHRQGRCRCRRRSRACRRCG